MHSKRKGNLGQQALAYWLARYGFSVFVELGDISRTDIIGEKNGQLIRFQCKAVTPRDGCLLLPLRKCGPNYRWKYTAELLDFFAVYDLVNHQLYLVPNSVLAEAESSFSLRLRPSGNGQTQGVHDADDYLADRILRDFTGGSPPARAEGDEKVQTATAAFAG